MRDTLRAFLKRITGDPVTADGSLDPQVLTHLRRSLSVYALVLVLLIWALAISYVVSDRKRELATAQQELLSLVAGLSLQTEAMLADGVGSAMATAARLDAAGLLAAEDPERIFEALRFDLTGGEYISALFITTPAGTYVVGRNDYQHVSSQAPVWQRSPVADVAIMLVGEPVEHPMHPGQRVIPIARPYGDGTREILAGAWFDVEALHHRYGRFAIGDGVIGLVGPTGSTLARTAFGSMQPLPAVATRNPTAEETNIWPTIGAEPRIIIADSATSGAKMIYAFYRPVAAARLFAAVGRTSQSIMAPLRVRMWAVFVGTSLATVMVLALTIFLHHHVSEIHNRETQFRQLIDTALVGIFLLKSGRIVQANQKAAEIFRVPSAAALIGLRPIDLSPALQDDGSPSAIAVQPYAEQLLREGKVTFHWTHKRLDTGEPFPANMSMSCLLLDSHSLILVIARDVSELEQARLELQRANETLEHRVAGRTEELQRAIAHLASVNQELEAFTAAASHDLRSPLSMISGQAGMLELELGASATTQQRERVSRIHAGVRRAVEVIDGMLSLARLSRQDTSRERVNLSELVHQAIAELKEVDPGRAVVSRIEEGIMVTADSRLMRSLITNLIGNAWKYSRNNERVEIEFQSESRHELGHAVSAFRITDRGAGFDMAHAKELFLPFRRLHSPKDFPGTGVGLAIVARVVHRYGGQIWAESEVGKGATFRFTLPLALGNDQAEEIASDKIAS
jgi:PAS domain S-box-containing protein